MTRTPIEEVITPQELRNLLETNASPKHYIGLEISGLLHLGSLILTGFKLNDFMKAGIRCTVFLADWHSYINNKFGGDWGKIRMAAEYYAEAFKLFAPGVDMLLGSELYHENDEYWKNFVLFCKQITLARNTRCLTIMGRTEKDRLDFGQYLYPPLQSVDIKAMDLDIVHAGIDQRKVHMLVREVFPRLKWKVPVAVHQHLLPGMSEPRRAGLDEDADQDLAISSKMSKSKPSSAIFVHDSEHEIMDKLRRAWCPEGEVSFNPVLEIAKYIAFRDGEPFEIQRAPKFGGPVSFGKYADLEEAFRQKKVHPADLKAAVAEAVNRVVEPVRRHFEGRRSLLEVYKDVE